MIYICIFIFFRIVSISQCPLHTESGRSGANYDGQLATQSGRSDINYYWWLTVELWVAAFRASRYLSDLLGNYKYLAPDQITIIPTANATM